jgi:hypothetical protein
MLWLRAQRLWPVWTKSHPDEEADRPTDEKDECGDKTTVLAAQLGILVGPTQAPNDKRDEDGSEKPAQDRVQGRRREQNRDAEVIHSRVCVATDEN